VLCAKSIDITFDVRSDSNGKDPDSSSSTLRQYHKALWSKPLPCGKLFNLDDNTNGAYLFHKSELDEYYLSSDSIIHTYFKWKRTQHIINQVPPEEMNYFYNLAHTIGGYIIFPSNRINELSTINQERGTNKRINDRIDLTLECIRLFYNDEINPMTDTLIRYKEFFSLFSGFKGYCEFFLLQDIISQDYSEVNFFLPFKKFEINPLPKNLDDYSVYRTKNIDFLRRRNKRINDFSQTIATKNN
jgi:hypothetical protein